MTVTIIAIITLAAVGVLIFKAGQYVETRRQRQIETHIITTTTRTACHVCDGTGFKENGELCNNCNGDGIVSETASVIIPKHLIYPYTGAMYSAEIMRTK
jgi:hypothetical protein